MKRIVRRVTRRVYDSYAAQDYNLLTDNLNPQNPTSLENQFDDMIQAVKGKVLSAYERSHITPPSDLFEVEVPDAHTLLNAIDDLQKMRNQNPLKDLAEKGFDLYPFIQDSLNNGTSSFMDNPLVLDCEGIDKTLSNSGNSDNSNNSNNNSSSSSSGSSSGIDDASDWDEDSENINEGWFTLRYEVSNGSSNPMNPNTYTYKDCPITLNAAIPNEGFTFVGWYLDKDFNNLVIGNKFLGTGKNTTLYGCCVESQNTGNDTISGSGEGSNLASFDGLNESNCSQTELAWLKIIMIILILIQVLIKVFVIVYNIQRVIAEMAKDAQLCWINPPSMQSLISYVMQRLSAIIFQLISMILLKIWSMLNFDCVVGSANDMMDQINTVMSGIGSVLGQIDALALNTSGSDLMKSISDALEKSKQNLEDQLNNFEKEFNWENVKKQLSDAIGTQVESYKELFTNPKAFYNDAVPPEIKQKIESVVSNYNSTVSNIESVVNGFTALQNKMSSKNNKMQGEDLKGIKEQPVST